MGSISPKVNDGQKDHGGIGRIIMDDTYISDDDGLEEIAPLHFEESFSFCR